MDSQAPSPRFAERTPVGNDPSLADIVKMVHPKPASKSQEALFGYLIGREYASTDLPEIVRRMPMGVHGAFGSSP
jgi:hypothetical protein